MQVEKLTITPLMKSAPHIEITKPDTAMAGILIKERLSSGSTYDDDKTARVFRRIPKFLKGFVNPQTKVGEVRNFRADV